MGDHDTEMGGMSLAQHKTRFAVIGAGHGGTALAGYLAVRGYTVNLFNRSLRRLEGILEAGGIQLEGSAKGFGRLEYVGSDIERALYGVDVVMVVVPASGHLSVAELCASHLTHGQLVLLNPGRTGGALEFYHTIRSRGNSADVIVAEAQTFLFASRRTGEASAKIFGTKSAVPVAALPATKTARALALLKGALPQFVAASDVLETSFDNIGAIFHPTPMILNAGRIQATGGDFDYYREGITPAVAKVLEQLDAERVAVARAYGARARSARRWMADAYGVERQTLYDAIVAHEGYRGIRAPVDLNHRYIFEDVPMSLVPISSMGQVAGVETPTIDAVIQLASVLLGEDYWALGRTVDVLGLEGMSVEEVKRYVRFGESR